MYYIESKAGQIMGVYQGNTPEEAVNALNEDVGGQSSTDDWIILEVTAIEREAPDAMLLALENGAYLMAIGEYPWWISYYRTKEDALRAWEKWNPTE